MLLRGSLDLAPESLLANPQLEMPFLHPESHRNKRSPFEPRRQWLSKHHTKFQFLRSKNNVLTSLQASSYSLDQRRLAFLCLTVTTEFVSFQDEEAGRTLGVLLIDAVG